MYQKRGLPCLAFTLLILLVANMMIVFNTDNCKASESTIWVDDSFLLPGESDGSMEKPYVSIQAGIDAAEEGDTVFVREGSYSGFSIDKGITVKGESVTNTFVHGKTKTSYLIDITGDYASLESIKIWDTTPTPHRKAAVHISSSAMHSKIIGVLINLSIRGYGIQIEGDNSIVENSTINNAKGINIVDSEVNTIFSNKIYDCGENAAINLINADGNIIQNNYLNDSQYGIHIRNSENNNIINNTIFDNTHIGIIIKNGANDNLKNNTIYNNSLTSIDIVSSKCNIVSNIIYESDFGINIGGNDGIIRNNTIKTTSFYGINTEPATSGNTIFNNTLINKVGGYYAKENGNNQWFNQDLQIGNYWKDFRGPDPNNESTLDSLDDSAFYYTKGGVLDKYPTGRYQRRPRISSPSPSHLESGVDLQPSLSVYVVDPDGGDMEVSFYYRMENESFFIDSVNNVVSENTVSIPFFSLEENRNAVYTYIGAGFDYICEWYVVAKDKYSKTNSSKYLFTTVTSPLDNEKPVADVGGPYQDYEINDIINFVGSNSYDPDGEIVFYKWSFGDGKSVVNVKNTTHSYSVGSSEGKTYEVTLTIIDNKGSSDTDTTFLTIYSDIVNSPPRASIDAPAEAIIGEQINFKSNSKDSDDDTLTCTWVIENSNYTGSNLKYTFTKPGTYPITLKVTDGEDNDVVSVNIKINDKPDETPGFEIIIFFVSLLLASLLVRKKLKQ